MSVRQPIVAALVLVAFEAIGGGQIPAQPRSTSAAGRPNFSGEWILNRELSDAPQPGADRAADTDRSRGGFGGVGGRGGFGRRGGFGGGYGRGRGGTSQSTDERAAVDEAIDEARSPSPSLLVSHSADNIAITDARGRTRFFQTSGAKDKHQLAASTLDSTTSWAGDDLVIQYQLGTRRRLIYTYTLVPENRQLVVRVRVDGGTQYSGHATTVKYVYDAARAK
jgi:hypothetical protein